MWKSLNLSWAHKFNKPTLIVYYEELKKKMRKTLRKILEFVKFPVDKNLMRCTLTMSDGNHKRTHNGTFNPFTPDLLKMIEETQEQVYKALGKKRTPIKFYKTDDKEKTIILE